MGNDSARWIPPALHGPRVTVRPFEEADWPGFRAFMDDAEATRYLLFSDEQRTEDGARELFDGVRASYASAEPVCALCIALPEGGFIGSCGASSIEPRCCEIYYSLLPAQWAQGYAIEAVKLIVPYLVTQCGMREIRAYTHPSNEASARVAVRAGFERVGPAPHPHHGVEGVLHRLRASSPPA